MVRSLPPIRTLSYISTVFLMLGILEAFSVTCGAQSGALDLSGSPADPFAMSKDKIVVLIFVLTDCPISNRYAPAIQQLSTQYAGKAAFFLIYPNRKETAETIRKHNAEFGYTITALRDPQHTLVKLSQAQITPEAAIFDAKRSLIYHGRIDNLYEDFGRARRNATTHELSDVIQAVIAGKSVSTTVTPAVGCYISDLK